MCFGAPSQPFRESSLTQEVFLMVLKSTRQVLKGSLPFAPSLPSSLQLQRGSTRQTSLHSVGDPLPEHSSFPRRKEVTVGDLTSLCQLSDCFPQVRGKEQPALEWGAGGPLGREAPPHPSVPAKRDIGYPGESARKRALIAEPGDKHDYQLRALSQKVS